MNHLFDRISGGQSSIQLFESRAMTAKQIHPMMTVGQYRKQNSGPAARKRVRVHLLEQPRLKDGKIFGRAACGRAPIKAAPHKSWSRGGSKSWNPGVDVICDTSPNLSTLSCVDCIRKAYELDLLKGINVTQLADNVWNANCSGAFWGPQRIYSKGVDAFYTFLRVELRRDQLAEQASNIISDREASYDTLDWQEKHDRETAVRRM